MISMTESEYHELRDEIINLAHDLLGTIDYHYLKDRSLIYALCSIHADLSSGLLNFERRISDYRKHTEP